MRPFFLNFRMYFENNDSILRHVIRIPSWIVVTYYAPNDRYLVDCVHFICINKAIGFMRNEIAFALDAIR